MKVLIAYASAGTGHFKAAQALYNYCKENHQTLDIKIIDALEKTSPLFKKLYTYGYLFLVNYALWLWWFTFWITSLRCSQPVNNIVNFVINRLNARNFAKFLIQENPNFIISTHFLASEISAYLKKTRQINSKLVTVITDFAVHPFWIYDATDTYIVASAFAREQLVSKGVRENKIKEFGIPIDAKFLVKYDRNILLKKFALEPNRFTVLIVTGSFGLGPIEEIVDLLYKDIQILVVCANNKGLYVRLKNKNYPKVRVFGFVDNIQEMMSVSDIIITKPGGLIISEILAMGIVPIFISPIPGQETQNLKVLERHGVGESVRHMDDIKSIILDHKEHPDKIIKIRENMKAIKKPFAAGDICNAICQGSIGNIC